MSNSGLDLEIQTGTFRIKLLDANGNVADEYDIAVDPGADTLDALAAAIDIADGTAGGGSLHGEVTADNKLRIYTAAGYTFQFDGDSSKALSSLGLNTFFSGSTARDIEVNPLLENDSDFVATPPTACRETIRPFLKSPR